MALGCNTWFQLYERHADGTAGSGRDDDSRRAPRSVCILVRRDFVGAEQQFAMTKHQPTLLCCGDYVPRFGVLGCGTDN